jgi:hypothetical protein
MNQQVRDAIRYNHRQAPNGICMGCSVEELDDNMNPTGRRIGGRPGPCDVIRVLDAWEDKYQATYEDGYDAGYQDGVKEGLES